MDIKLSPPDHTLRNPKYWHVEPTNQCTKQGVNGSNGLCGETKHQYIIHSIIQILENIGGQGSVDLHIYSPQTLNSTTPFIIILTQSDV